MKRISTFARSSFGSAALGGIIVALFGWAAIAAGWIEADEPGGSSRVATATRPVADGGSHTVQEIYGDDAPAVAFIEARPQERPSGSFGLGGGTATGSGFLIDADGHIVTNAHVVDGAGQITVKMGTGDDSIEAELVGADPSTDVALLSVDPAAVEGIDPLSFGDGKVEVGDPVVAIGNPFGLERTVTTGIVSALQREIEAPNGFAISEVIQTDAAINPGNSGGPLLGASGEVIGINSQIATDGGSGSVGIGFAVPATTAGDVVDQLLSDGEVVHAYLGIQGTDLTPELADRLGVDAGSGALVTGVERGGPADRAGLQAGRRGGDVITSIDGEPVDSMSDVVAAVNRLSPGTSLQLGIVRDGTSRTIGVTLGERPAAVG